MDDDFNTSAALAVLFDIAHALNKARASDPAAAARLASELRALGGILGLLTRDPEDYLRGGDVETGEELQIIVLIAQRDAARQRRDWAEADRLRDALKTKGVLLEDVPGGKTVWRRQ